jgi:hypothetical protein
MVKSIKNKNLATSAEGTKRGEAMFLSTNIGGFFVYFL